MTFPTDGFGILSYLALLVPGIVFIMVRSQFRGFREVDRTVGGRLLHAFVVSVVFDAIYFALFASVILERLQTGTALTPGEATIVGWVFIVAGLVLPAVVSWIMYGEGKLISPRARAHAR